MSLRSFLLSVAIFTTLPGHGQQSLDSIALSRNNLVRHSMLVLGSWAIANIATGFTVAGNVQGEARYAWRMNGYWNFINLGLASIGYLNARRATAKNYGFADNMKAQHTLEKIYVFNIGLDMAYIAGGLYLRERGNSASTQRSAEQFRGYGSSIIIQGSFLLLMDAIVYQLHHRNTNILDRKLRQFDLTLAPAGVGINYRF
jgi:hypothetical protein